ncbi:MAG: KUP/HAK/KT family potassium transporter, partial [Marinomonas sp.]
MSAEPTESANAQGGTVQTHGSPQRNTAIAKLAAGAIGIVFGDIGTSPLYAFRETFIGAHPLELDRIHVLGVVSLIFWSMT